MSIRKFIEPDLNYFYKKFIDENIPNPDAVRYNESAQYNGSQKPPEFFEAWNCIDKFYTKNPTDKISFLEIGAYRGLWALALAVYGKYKKIDIHYSTITLMGHNGRNKTLYDVQKCYKSNFGFQFDLIDGSSMDKKSLDQLPLPKYNIVFIDGDHSYKAVMSDNKFYVPLASDLVLWHDVVGKKDVEKALEDSKIELDETIWVERPSNMGIGIKYIK